MINKSRHVIYLNILTHRQTIITIMLKNYKTLKGPTQNIMGKLVSLRDALNSNMTGGAVLCI